MQFILFFIPSWCKVASALKELNKFCPPNRIDYLCLLFCINPSSMLAANPASCPTSTYFFPCSYLHFSPIPLYSSQAYVHLLLPNGDSQPSSNFLPYLSTLPQLTSTYLPPATFSFLPYLSILLHSSSAISNYLIHYPPLFCLPFANSTYHNVFNLTTYTGPLPCHLCLLFT